MSSSKACTGLRPAVLVCEHGFGLSYNWLRLSLQAHGKIKPAPRRGAHRRKRPRRPVVGMMLHQDGSSHEWVALGEETIMANAVNARLR